MCDMIDYFLLLYIKDIGFGKISAESNPEICQSLGISAVPTTLLFQRSKEVFRLSGTRVRELAEKLVYYVCNLLYIVHFATNRIILVLFLREWTFLNPLNLFLFPLNLSWILMSASKNCSDKLTLCFL